MTILANETLVAAREVPFHLPDVTNVLNGITGHVFTAGEVQIRLPGAGYVNATVGNIVEKGFGDYALQLTEAQTATEGGAYIYANVAGAQPYSGIEEIADDADGVVVNETVDAKRELAFHLPSSADPLTPVTGHVFTLGEVQICLPGGVYANADQTRVVEKGFGDYALQLTDPQVAARGKIYLRVNAAGAQPWTAWYDVVPPAASGFSAPMITNLTPADNIDPGEIGAFSADYSTARNTPIQFDLTDIPSGAGITISAKFFNRDETYIVLDHDGVFQWPFDAHSTIGVLTAEPVHVSLLPRDGWPPTPVTIKVAAVAPAVGS